jgi:hypothetical protein
VETFENGEISGFCCVVVEVFALLRCSMAKICSWLPLLWDSILIPSSRVKKSILDLADIKVAVN